MELSAGGGGEQEKVEIKRWSQHTRCGSTVMSASRRKDRALRAKDVSKMTSRDPFLKSMFNRR